MPSPERDTYHGVSELPSGMLGLSLCKAPAESGVPQLGTALNEEHPPCRSLPARRAAPPCRRYTPLAAPDELTQANQLAAAAAAAGMLGSDGSGKTKGEEPHTRRNEAWPARFSAGLKRDGQLAGAPHSG